MKGRLAPVAPTEIVPGPDPELVDRRLVEPRNGPVVGLVAVHRNPAVVVGQRPVRCPVGLPRRKVLKVYHG